MPDVIDDFNREDTNSKPNTTDADKTSTPEAKSSASSAKSFSSSKSPKKSKKKLIIALAIAIIVVIGIGATAFAMYYNNPDKVLLDAFQNGIKSKTAIVDGSATFKDTKNNGTVAITFTSQSNGPKVAGSLDAKIKINYSDVKIDLTGAGMVAESGDFYFKVDNATKLLDQYLATDSVKVYTSEPSLAPIVTKVKALVAKMDGQWIKVDKAVISQFSKDYDKNQTCSQKVIAKFYDDSAQQQQVIDTYSSNRFIVMKDTGKSETINGQDSVAYNLTFNEKKANAFGTALNNTDVLKALSKCSEDQIKYNTDNTKTDQQKQKDADKTKVTVWISRWGHQLTKVQLSDNNTDSSSDIQATIDTSKTPNLKAPASSLNAKDLMQEFQDIYTEALGGSTTTGF